MDPRSAKTCEGGFFVNIGGSRKTNTHLLFCHEVFIERYQLKQELNYFVAIIKRVISVNCASRDDNSMKNLPTHFNTASRQSLQLH